MHEGQRGLETHAREMIIADEIPPNLTAVSSVATVSIAESLKRLVDLLEPLAPLVALVAAERENELKNRIMP